MNTRLLDVLHDAADENFIAVAQRVHVHFRRVFEEAVHQHRPLLRIDHRLAHVAVDRGFVVGDDHRATAEHVAGTNQDGIAQAARNPAGLFGARGCSVFGLWNLQISQQRPEALTVFGQIDRFRVGPDNRHALLFERQRKRQRRLAAELHDHAVDLLGFVDVEHVLERQRLEVEPIAGVIVGGHGLGIAVDHERLIAQLLQRVRSMTAAVVELDSLPDAVGSAAQNHHLPAFGGLGLALFLVGGVQIRREAFKLRRASVHPLEYSLYAVFLAFGSQSQLAGPKRPRHPLVRQSVPLRLLQLLSGDGIDRFRLQLGLQVDEVLHLLQEPGIDPRHFMDLLDRIALRHRETNVVQSFRSRRDQPLIDLRGVEVVFAELLARLETADRLRKRMLEGAADRHHFTDRLHLHAEQRLGAREFLELPFRQLDNDVVDRRLEARRRLARNVVRNLVQPHPDGQLGGDLRDREARGLRGQGGASRDARVHFDHHHPPGIRLDRELHVRPARIDPDLPQAGQRSVAHHLVLAIGQRLRRRHGQRVARVDAHRVKVLDRTDDDAVVREIAHHLELELLPAEHALLDQHLVHRRQLEGPGAKLLHLLAVVGETATRTPEREARPQHDRISHFRAELHAVFEVVDELRVRHIQADAPHGVLEQQPVLGLLDGLDLGADQLDAELIENAFLRQLDGQVQARLPAHRREQRVRSFASDDLANILDRQRLDVGLLGQSGVGHDRRGIRIHQHDLISLVAERLAGLRARVVELASLPDHDRPRADDQDLVDVRSLRHSRLRLPPQDFFINSTNSSKRYRESWGPGAASG